jgi:DNA topoisomerase-1
MNETMLARLHAQHLYTVTDLAALGPERLARLLDLPRTKADRLSEEAGEVLTLLRKRSDLRKFVRKYLPPRRGRKQTEIMNRLFESGINEVRALAQVDPKILKGAGIGEKEAASLLEEARRLCSERLFRDIGIPAASRKKYEEAGVLTPEELCGLPPVYLQYRTGLSLDTVMRHLEKICASLGQTPPRKPSRLAVEKGRKALLSIPGLGENTLERLYRAGITGPNDLISWKPGDLAEATGLSESRIREFILSAGSLST